VAGQDGISKQEEKTSGCAMMSHAFDGAVDRSHQFIESYFRVYAEKGSAVINRQT
jgi:hypothetical protein